jgi:UDP-N-acetylglucosamine acyltransferase
LAGHVTIQDFVTIGGMTAVSQFTTIGRYAFVGGKSGVSKDIPPFTRGGGHPFKIVGLNSIGLQRRGFSPEQIAAIKKIYKLFYLSGLNVSQAKEKVTEMGELTPEQLIFVEFINSSQRGIVK